MKLISMADFVLEQYKEIQHSNVFENNCYKYSDFLKQPLNLGMFVPCDENGNVLNEKSIFNATDEDYIFDSESFDKYNESKEKVLFEGFLNPFGDYVKNEKIIIRNRNNSISIQEHFEDIVTKLSKSAETIEDLVQYNLELTENAIKQL